MDLTNKELAILNLLYFYNIEEKLLLNDFIDVPETIYNLKKKSYLYRDEETKEIKFTPKTFAFFKERKDVSKKAVEQRANTLTPILQRIFPKGKKNNQYYWKGTKKEIASKLKKFIRENPNYSNEEIIQATKDYVNSFSEFERGSAMQLLKYFIEKNNGSVLLEYLENPEQNNTSKITLKKM